MENEFLDKILFELQMNYVDEAKKAESQKADDKKGDDDAPESSEAADPGSGEDQGQ